MFFFYGIVNNKISYTLRKFKMEISFLKCFFSIFSLFQIHFALLLQSIYLELDSRSYTEVSYILPVFLIKMNKPIWTICNYYLWCLFGPLIWIRDLFLKTNESLTYLLHFVHDCVMFNWCFFFFGENYCFLLTYIYSVEGGGQCHAKWLFQSLFAFYP